MEENKITVHQAFYGEVNRSHSSIRQTITDPDLTSFLLAFTDRPAALPPGVNLLPYISGSAYSKYYVLTKTFPDATATRAGMVFTHALIVNLIDIDLIGSFEDIVSLFVNSIDDKNNELRELKIDCPRAITPSHPKYLKSYIQQTIASFISGVKPILFSGDIKAFTEALQQIWNSPNIASRKKLKFRASFTPSDIENINDLTIVSIQKEFLSKWQAQRIIQAENQDLIEITSYSEGLFFGQKQGNPFYDFLVHLDISLDEVQNYGQYEKLFSNYVLLQKIDDANLLRQAIRLISKIAPASNVGSEIKEEFIERLSTVLANEREANIKALRNIEWSAFKEGEEKGKQIVSSSIKRQIEKLNRQRIQSLVELIDLSVNDVVQNWWHVAITETIRSTFERQDATSIKNLWQLMDSAESALKNILSIVEAVKNCDDILRRFLPHNLRMETCKTLLKSAENKKWFLFHADILLKEFSIEDALTKQVQVEEKLPLTASLGVTYLVEKLVPKDLIRLTLKLGDKKLIEICVEKIQLNFTLLKSIDLTNPYWLEVWTTLVLKTRKVFDGLVEKEQAIVFTLFDLIVEGKKVNNTLVGLIADSKFSDLGDYKNRSSVWRLINPIEKEKILISTSPTVLGQLIAGKIDSSSIELEVSNMITSDTFMTNFLSQNRDSIDPVIKVYSTFKNLKDNFLADYIHYYRSIISELQAKQLGELVTKNNFDKSARSIYDKAKYDPAFVAAYEICKELVRLNWFESLFGSVHKSIKGFSSPALNISPLSGEQRCRAQLPTVVILTAINEEYSAVKNHLNEVVEADQNDTNYEAGIFKLHGKEIAKVFIRECGAKNTTASQEAERAIQHFQPDLMFFVGIAGSRKPNDFSVGDVIFPEKVYSYEGGKSEKDAFVARPEIADMTYALKEIAKKERRKDDWKSLIKGNWSSDVKADLGVIASGEQVVEHYNSDIGRILTKHYNDTSVVEMEGFGFAKAASRQGRETSNILIGIVRGISDIIEQPSKNKTASISDRRPANAKKFASDTAAAFAYWLIFKLYK